MRCMQDRPQRGNTPAARGHQFGRIVLDAKKGPPPPARGTSRVPGVQLQINGTTPAGAGNIAVVGYPTGIRRDHPRERGEHPIMPTPRRLMPGPPPRARETPPPLVTTGARRGLPPRARGTHFLCCAVGWWKCLAAHPACHQAWMDDRTCVARPRGLTKATRRAWSRDCCGATLSPSISTVVRPPGYTISSYSTRRFEAHRLFGAVVPRARGGRSPSDRPRRHLAICGGASDSSPHPYALARPTPVRRASTKAAVSVTMRCPS